MTKRYGTQGVVRTALLIGLIGALINSANAVRADATQRALPAAAPPAAGGPALASDWHVTVRELAGKHFKNPAWGYSHCMRDYALARELAASDHVTLDDDVLFAAA